MRLYTYYPYCMSYEVFDKLKLWKSKIKFQNIKNFRFNMWIFYSRCYKIFRSLIISIPIGELSRCPRWSAWRRGPSSSIIRYPSSPTSGPSPWSSSASWPYQITKNYWNFTSPHPGSKSPLLDIYPQLFWPAKGTQMYRDLMKLAIILEILIIGILLVAINPEFSENFLFGLALKAKS